jgi:hypothetical protein
MYALRLRGDEPNDPAGHCIRLNMNLLVPIMPPTLFPFDTEKMWNQTVISPMSLQLPKEFSLKSPQVCVT